MINVNTSLIKKEPKELLQTLESSVHLELFSSPCCCSAQVCGRANSSQPLHRIILSCFSAGSEKLEKNLLFFFFPGSNSLTFALISGLLCTMKELFHELRNEELWTWEVKLAKPCFTQQTSTIIRLTQ